jgi:hypothetical protein
MSVPRLTAVVSRMRRSGPRRRVATSAMACLALMAGLGLGVLLAGGGDDLSAQRDTAAQVERLRGDLAAATRENDALEGVLASRRLRGLARADDEVVRLVDATMEAVNDKDVEGLERRFTSRAVLTDLGTGRVTHGATAIALAYGQLEEPHLRRVSEVFEMRGRAVWAYDTGVCVAVVDASRFRELVMLSPVPVAASTDHDLSGVYRSAR